MSHFTGNLSSMQPQSRNTCPHLCSFREYILAFFSCISCDVSEFAALLSIFRTRIIISMMMMIITQPAVSLCPVWEETKKEVQVISFSSSFLFWRMLQELPGGWESTSPFSLDVFTRRGEKSAETSSLWAERLQDRTDKFLHCGAEWERRGGRWRGGF